MNRVGQQFGNYILLNQIGKGGFAEVYLGEHIYLKTKAAIKVLHTHLAEEEHAGFLSEAQTIAHLQHPHIVRVLEFGVEGDTPYLVMEYAPNGTLRGHYPRGTVLPLSTILPVLKQVVAALQYAHDQNLIHRDVKPENMLIGEHNEVLLGDFGIALIVQGIGSYDHEEVVGTIGYMAPEQLLGKPRFASDQYALAVIVYEWLTGVRPFQGSYVEVSSQHIFTPPPPLREKAPDVSSAIEAAVMKALSKDPEQRFATIQEFVNALEAASASVPGHAEQTLVSTSATSRRTAPARLRALLVTTVLLILAAGGLVYPLLAPHTFSPLPSPEQIIYQQATSGTPAIVDSLSTNSPLVWNGDQGSCLFAGGALHVSGPLGAATCGPANVFVDDFASQVRVTIITGNHVTLSFRHAYNLANSPSYDFTITSSGQCGIFLENLSVLTKLDSSQSLLTLRPCAAIRTGPNRTNLITVIARKSNIYLYINKQYIAHVVDTRATSGLITITGVANGGHGPVDVALNNLQIWTL